jgi:hypothetical protein
VNYNSASPHVRDDQHKYLRLHASPAALEDLCNVARMIFVSNKEADHLWADAETYNPPPPDTRRPLAGHLGQSGSPLTMSF